MARVPGRDRTGALDRAGIVGADGVERDSDGIPASGTLWLSRAGADTLGIAGDEEFDILGLEGELRPRQDLTLTIRRPDGGKQEVVVQLRADTPIEIDYLRHGGILPYVLRGLLADAGN